MDLKITSDLVVVFDLDDTIHPEAEFVLSGFKAVAELFPDEKNKIFRHLSTAFAFGEPPIDRLIHQMPDLLNLKSKMLETYREHFPELKANPEVISILAEIRQKAKAMALITDGRKTSQRNKIQALGIEKFFDHIFISEECGFSKLESFAFDTLEGLYPGSGFIMLADNPAKDFNIPHKKGWKCICITNTGRNIHPQPLELTNRFQGLTFAAGLKSLKIS